MAAPSTFIMELQTKLSPEAKVLTDASSEEFVVALERWTDIGKQTPQAIVLVSRENDIVETIRLATEKGVPFVPKSGGHSAWSTIGAAGIIIDLSAYNGIKINKANSTTTVQGGVLNKALITALADEGLCCSFGSGNTVGVVPQALGGGISTLSRLIGVLSDNIVSARIVTGSGELIDVSSTSHPELLWGLRGAGQHFGLVTELTLQCYPLDILGGVGEDYGTVWCATIVFPSSRTAEVMAAVKPIVESEDTPAAGLIISTNDHESKSHVIVALVQYFGTNEAAKSHFEPLEVLGPLVYAHKRVPYADINNDVDPFCVKGGFKHFQLAGVPRFDADAKMWEEVSDIRAELFEKCPDAASTGYGIEWASGKSVTGKHLPETAYSHGNVKVWIECLSWHQNPSSEADVIRLENAAIKAATSGFKPEEVEFYQNFTREGPLEKRFGSVERVARLKALKSRWDPKGNFTTSFL